eukprot:118985-Ditylum_brightwellii.AAC.1
MEDSQLYCTDQYCFHSTETSIFSVHKLKQPNGLVFTNIFAHFDKDVIRYWAWHHFEGYEIKKLTALYCFKE